MLSIVTLIVVMWYSKNQAIDHSGNFHASNDCMVQLGIKKKGLCREHPEPIVWKSGLVHCIISDKIYILGHM
jgi:hypothetical protein